MLDRLCACLGVRSHLFWQKIMLPFQYPHLPTFLFIFKLISSNLSLHFWLISSHLYLRVFFSNFLVYHDSFFFRLISSVPFCLSNFLLIYSFFLQINSSYLHHCLMTQAMIRLFCYRLNCQSSRELTLPLFIMILIQECQYLKGYFFGNMQAWMKSSDKKKHLINFKRNMKVSI